MTAFAPAPARSNEGPLWTLVSLLVGSGFFALWFWLLPRWLNFVVDLHGVSALRLVALVPSVLGFSVALRCIYDFGRTGHGTPAPMVPPQRLVVVGYYRHVRNPMYVGFFAGWLGLWTVFGRATWATVIAAAAVVLSVHLFVMFYEEPTLASKFGRDYEEYCRNVRRWLPRVRAWREEERE
jgi:protein-S-isoprenylcysteine O-methyltransferase Ste14